MTKMMNIKNMKLSNLSNSNTINNNQGQNNLLKYYTTPPSTQGTPVANNTNTNKTNVLSNYLNTGGTTSSPSNTSSNLLNNYVSNGAAGGVTNGSLTNSVNPNVGKLSTSVKTNASSNNLLNNYTNNTGSTDILNSNNTTSKNLLSNYLSSNGDGDTSAGLSTLDKWLNENKNTIDQNRLKELEESYVQRELLNKYLDQDQKVAGLSGSGLAPLYNQQANVDYMNQRANINSNYASQEQDLMNNYTTQKLAEEEQNKLDWYDALLTNISGRISEYQDEETGKITVEDKNALYKYLEENSDKISSHHRSVLENYIDESTMSEEQNAKTVKIKQDAEEIIKTYGDNVDTSNPIDPNEAGASSFGTKFRDAGTGKGEQDKYVERIINMAKDNLFKNGDLINIDYGNQQAEGESVYLYYNGNFYKTNMKGKYAKYNNSNISSILIDYYKQQVQGKSTEEVQKIKEKITKKYFPENPEFIKGLDLLLKYYK